MRKLRNYGACMAAAVLSAALLLASCRHAGGGGGGGAVYTPSSGSSGGGTEAAASTTATYTSYDSAGGYFNVNGGQYRTCTLTGNSTGGTITLSNGVSPNLTGSYGTPNGSVSLTAAPNVELKIEGCFTVTFNGVSSSYSYSVLITRELISLRCVGSNGTKILYTAGAAVSSDSAAAATGNGIAPGSTGDPFNGTRWSSYSINDEYPCLFKDGGVYRYTSVYKNGAYEDEYQYWYSYIVVKTSDGYKLCYDIKESTLENMSGSAWAVVFWSLTVPDASAVEGQKRLETHGYGYANGYTARVDQVTQSITCYRITP